MTYKILDSRDREELEASIEFNSKYDRIEIEPVGFLSYEDCKNGINITTCDGIQKSDYDIELFTDIGTFYFPLDYDISNLVVGDNYEATITIEYSEDGTPTVQKVDKLVHLIKNTNGVDKANLEIIPIDFNIGTNVYDVFSGSGVYTLEEIQEQNWDDDYITYTLVFDDGGIVFPIYCTQAEFATLGFVVGGNYKLTIDLDNQSIDKVERIIDLKDKVNITDLEAEINRVTQDKISADQLNQAVADATETVTAELTQVQIDLGDLKNQQDDLKGKQDTLKGKQDTLEGELVTKANLEYKKIDLSDFYVHESWDLQAGNGVYVLNSIDIQHIDENLKTYGLFFNNEHMCFGIDASPDTFDKLGFVVGKAYRITAEDFHLSEVEKILDLEDKINIFDIDQSYNPTSPNPQSGTAVAEAITGSMNEFEGNIKTVNGVSLIGSGDITISADGTIAATDTTYNPESTNAQSGIAVAEAFALKDFELLCDTTITEDIAEIKWTTTDNGESIRNYKDFFIYFIGKFTANANNEVMMCRGNGGGEYFMYRSNYAKSADLRTFWLQIETILTTDKIDCHTASDYVGDGLFIKRATYPQSFLSNANSEGYLSTQGLSGNNQAVYSDITIKNLSELPLRDLYFGTRAGSTSVFATGSRFLLFGRKA